MESRRSQRVPTILGFAQKDKILTRDTEIAHNLIKHVSPKGNTFRQCLVIRKFFNLLFATSLCIKVQKRPCVIFKTRQ